MDRLAKSMTERAMHTETSLLDMDMVKGSSMRKRWVDRRLNSIATQRIILMPLHSRYWAGQLGWGIAAPLALLWVMYASLLYSRSVRSTIWIPGWAQHLNLWSVGKGADMELFSYAWVSSCSPPLQFGSRGHTLTPRLWIVWPLGLLPC
jgi:hypothetical protein